MTYKPEWPILPISDVCELIVDCINKTAPSVPEPTPYKMIRTTNIRHGRVSLESVKYVTEETFKKWTRRSDVKRGDVLFTREAPLGEVGIVDFDDKIFLGQRTMQYRADVGKLLPEYLYYSMLSPFMQNQFRSFEGSGSVVSHIRVPECFKFTLVLSPLEYQKDVVRILLPIDTLIGQCKQTAKALEGVARALYRSWFVDFEPTRAKMAAKEAGQDPEQAAMAAISGRTLPALQNLKSETRDSLRQTAGLFPDTLDPKTNLPTGWESLPLTAMVKLIGGGTPKKSESSYWDGDIPWFAIKDVPAEGQVYVVNTTDHITELGLKKSSTKIIPEGATIITARGTVGKLALVGTPMAMNQSCYGVVGQKGLGSYFTYYTLVQAIQELQKKVHGAVFDTITRATFETTKGVKPTAGILEAFESKLHPIMSMIKLLHQQSQTLAELRDALLPKLLSGEITPGEARVLTEEALA